MMSPQKSVANSLRRYFDFKGRASRSEFWWFQLFYLMSYHGSLRMGGFLEGHVPFVTAFILGGIVNLLLIIPLLSSQVRRMHDTGHSGWWVFAFYAGWICMLLLPQADKSTPLPVIILYLGYVMFLLGLALYVIAQYFRGSNPNGDIYGKSDEAKEKYESYKPVEYVQSPYYVRN